MAPDATIHMHDLPEPMLLHIFSLVADVRTRNAMALACRRWRALERATRTSLALRGHVRSPLLLPTSFPAVAHLDLSLLSPWGHHHLPHQVTLVAARLAQAFPRVSSLAVYARDPSALAALAPLWPGLRAARLVRWHPRPPSLPLGADLAPLLAACPALAALDLSQFYCWTEDVPQALRDHPAAAASLARLDLLCPASADGFRSSDLTAIAAACPNLTHLRAPCVFNPRCIEFVGDDALIALAAGCPRLSLLHLVDPATLSPARSDSDAREYAAITGPGLEGLFGRLPRLENLVLDLCHNVWDAGPALEALSYKCPKVKSLKLGQFHGVCKGAWLHLDGVSFCGRLESLCIKNSADLTDSSLATIARGCRRLSKLEIHGCNKVTEVGIKKLASMLRSTLVDVAISGCQLLDATRSLRALEPIRDRIERLHIDCIWAPESIHDRIEHLHIDTDVDEMDEDMSDDESRNKKRRCSDGNHGRTETSCFLTRAWRRLRCLSLWIPAGEILTPLGGAGLESCPQLEDICIKVEGDCRTWPRPRQSVFGLSFLARYDRLAKMKLDCGEAIGYSLTAPTGHIDLSSWERFYLHGIGDLRLCELHYWPPQDKEMNQRSLSHPAAGLIGECLRLRKLFIHGTAHEHFMGFFLAMPRLRDVQFREDYYPAHENDMSTEMRADSCTRFEQALNSRVIPD